MIVKDPIVHCDCRGQRMLDLSPFGIPCIPLLSHSTFNRRRRGTVFHVHPGCTEICLCLKGRLMFESEDREFNFLPGTVFVSSPDQPHRMRNNPKGLTTMTVLFRHPRPRSRILDLPRRESEWLAAALAGFPRRLFAATGRLQNAFARLFEIYDLRTADADLRRLEMRAAALELLLAVIDASVRSPKTFPEKFRSVAKRMEDDPGRDYPISLIAKETGTPEFRITEIFKRVTGLPPHAWLIECRIRAAQKMLANGDDSISAISDRLGFSSSQHFAGAFLKSVGLSPRDWRKRMRKNRATAVSPRAT